MRIPCNLFDPFSGSAPEGWEPGGKHRRAREKPEVVGREVPLPEEEGYPLRSRSRVPGQECHRVGEVLRRGHDGPGIELLSCELQ